MGENLAAPPADAPPELFVQVIGSAPLQHLDVIRRGQPPERIPLEENWQATVQKSISGLTPGDWVYVRVEQIDHGMAWSSPVFIQ